MEVYIGIQSYRDFESIVARGISFGFILLRLALSLVCLFKALQGCDDIQRKDQSSA